MNRRMKSDDKLHLKAEEALKKLPFCKEAVKLKAIIALRTLDLGKVAELFGYSPNTMRNWVRRFDEEGVPGLKDKPRRPRPSKLNQSQTEEILKLIEAGDRNYTLHGIKSEIKKRYNVTMSLNGIWLLLKRKGYSHATFRNNGRKNGPTELIQNSNI